MKLGYVHPAAPCSNGRRGRSGHAWVPVPVAPSDHGLQQVSTPTPLRSTILLGAVLIALCAPVAGAAELELRTGPDGRKNVLVKRGDARVALTEFDRPQHIYDFAASPDGKHAFVWHMESPPRIVSVYNLGTRRRTAEFRPGYGGSLRWTCANTLLHVWRAGTSYQFFQLYDRRGRVLLGATAEAFEVSPSVRFLAGRPDIAGRQRLRVWDLAANRLRIDRPTQGAPWFSFDVRWEGDHTLHLLFEDEPGERTKDVPLDLRPPLELSVLGQSLYLREGNEDRLLLRAAPPAEGRSSADVIRVHSVVAAPTARAAAVLLSLNRQTCLLPVQLDAVGELAWGTALPVPDASEVSFSPRGDAMLVVSTRDAYLPCDAPFKLNRGAMLLRPGDLDWHPEIEQALRERGKGLWYGRPDERYVAEGDFEVRSVRWTEEGCVLYVRTGDVKKRRLSALFQEITLR